MKTGKLYGVGVGPGDPELITLKAVRIIENCPVLAIPRTSGEHSMAFDIASQSVDVSQKELLYLDFSMSPKSEVRKENHAALSKAIMIVLDRGNDVAMLNIGDPSLFGTFSYLAEIVQTHGYDVETIAGVTSFCACAATLNQSLTSMREPLHIFPASYEDLENGLQLTGGKVIMKSASALPEVFSLVRQHGLSAQTTVVSDCGLPAQRVFHNVSSIEEESYFTTILIKP